VFCVLLLLVLAENRFLLAAKRIADERISVEEVDLHRPASYHAYSCDIDGDGSADDVRIVAVYYSDWLKDQPHPDRYLLMEEPASGRTVLLTSTRPGPHRVEVDRLDAGSDGITVLVRELSLAPREALGAVTVVRWRGGRITQRAPTLVEYAEVWLDEHFAVLDVD